MIKKKQTTAIGFACIDCGKTYRSFEGAAEHTVRELHRVSVPKLGTTEEVGA